MNKPKPYKSVNLKPEAYAELQQVIELLSNKYTIINIGNLVAQLIHEKHEQLTLKK
jgi:hypothetical protein